MAKVKIPKLITSDLGWYFMTGWTKPPQEHIPQHGIEEVKIPHTNISHSMG